MKNRYLVSIFAMLCMALGVSAQSNTYNMVIEMTDGTKINVGPNDIQAVTFNEGQLTVTGDNLQEMLKSLTEQLAQQASTLEQQASTLEQQAAALAQHAEAIQKLATPSGEPVEGLAAVKQTADAAMTLADSLRRVVNSTIMPKVRLFEGYEKQIASYQGEYNQAKTDMAQLKTRVTNLETKATTNDTDVATLKSDISTLNTTIGTQKSAIDTNTKDITTLRQDLKTSTDQLKTDLGKKAEASELSTLQSTVKKQADDIAALTKKLNDLQAAVDKLSKQ